MNTTSEDIGTLLESSINTLTLGTNLFIGLLPDQPDLGIALIDSPGMPPDPNNYYHPGLQVLVRASVGDYSVAAALSQSVMDVLHTYVGQPDVNSYFYTLVWSMGDPFFIGLDTNHRPLFSTNYRIQRRSS